MTPNELEAVSRELRALNRLLDGEPPYPVGTAVRQMQDRRDELTRLTKPD